MEHVSPHLYTVGHSTRSLDELLDLLRVWGVQQVVDVRTIPRSRRNPQFEGEALRQGLAAAGLSYLHLKSLGGLRRPRRDSPNTAWHNDSFRGYADYMQTPEFEQALQHLLAAAQAKPTAILCAEAVPWRCHRSMIADALSARGLPVRHILSPTAARLHSLHPAARVDQAGRISYPASPQPAPLGDMAQALQQASLAKKESMPRGASPKREREFEELKGRFEEEGRYPGREEEVAARIVNKQRSQHGETREARKEARRGESPDRGLPIKGYQHMTVAQIRRRLGRLSREQVLQIRQYEVKHKNRRSLLEAIDRRA